MEKSISFEQLPLAVAQLTAAVAALHELVASKANAATVSNQRAPIGIDRACELLQKAKPTVYFLARNGGLPCYKQGKKLYFYEDELLAHIATGRRSTVREIQSKTLQNYDYEQ